MYRGMHPFFKFFLGVVDEVGDVDFVYYCMYSFRSSLH